MLLQLSSTVTVLIAICSNCWSTVDGVENIPAANKSEIQTIATNKPKQDENKLDSKLEKISLPEYLEKQHLSGFDIPLDAFSLHHPFFQPHLKEFQFSNWYFLFFTIFYNNSNGTREEVEENGTADVADLVPEITKALSTKLSVPVSIFSVSKAEKYRSNAISANLSLANHTIPHLHQKLTNLHTNSPLFWLKGIRYKLVQVIHDRNQHLFVRNESKVSKTEISLLIIVTLGGIIIFLALVMLALLNCKLYVTKDPARDLVAMLRETEEMEHDPIFTIERKQMNQDEDGEEEQDNFLQQSAIDDSEGESTEKFQFLLFKKLRYCKTLF